MNKQKLVLVGNGMAGVRCVEEIIKLEPEAYDITIFGGEPHPNYNRIMLSKVLQGDTRIADITINDWNWYKDNGITLHAGDPIVKIDATARTIASFKGVVVPYDRLILAMGSLPFMLPLPGSDLPGVTAFRDISDCNTMMDASRKYKKAVVIGGGLLGLEAARGLLNLGMEVDVVHINSHIMERQLDSDAAEMLRKELENQGMRFLLGKHTERILGRKRVEGLLFKDGTRVAADLVVMAVGVRPNVKLAAEGGIEVNRAIVVNDRMETNIPGVYAVGECAEHRGMVYGLVAPLYEQGKVLAKAICGLDTEGYQGSVLYSQLKVSGVEVFSAGEIRDAECDANFKLQDGIRKRYKKITFRNNRIVGAVLFGDSSEGNKLLGYIKQGADVSVLDREAGAGTDSDDDAIHAMSDKETVCSCNGVSKGAIATAIREDKLETFEEVRECTRASSSCGGCKPLVASILRITLSSEESDIQKRTVCECTNLDHEELRKAVQSNRFINLREARLGLGWKSEEGCSVCNPALNYYIGQHYQGVSFEAAIPLADGTYSVVPRIHGGLVRPEHLRRIAYVIDKYDVPHAKVGGARFELFGIPRESLGQLISELGLPVANASHGGYPIAVTACEGLRYDRFAFRDSVAMAVALERQVEGMHLPTPLSVAVSASPLHRAGTLTRDVGLVGAPGGWEIYVGGSTRDSVLQARLLDTPSEDQAALELAVAFLQAYREQAHYGETTWNWIDRVGLVALREQLFDEAYRYGLIEQAEADRMGGLEKITERQPTVAQGRVE
ncbi:nitrite reductase large subunit NirB [Cohnella lupini]|uniref:Nitrite reductase (NADH) large subunit n=1 Tax=Cohnella lupini TaxID=1294267 RepID=A0A3D9IS52_9BACL|nr:nitrite reductase large subunit NirB [Cohnella lupini]RED64631.1 nitrite reductase (NADH) large subunit [Cohnella lupini]